MSERFFCWLHPIFVVLVLHVVSSSRASLVRALPVVDGENAGDGSVNVESWGAAVPDNSQFSESSTSSAITQKCINDFNFTFHHPNLFKNDCDTKMAYRMAALSALVYFPFHKKLDQQGHFDLPFEFRLTGKRLSWSQWTRCCLFRSLQDALPSIWIFATATGTTSSSSPSCRTQSKIRYREHARHGWILRYWLYDWHEPTAIPGVRYHDTDLLVSTSVDNQQLVVTFAGTASAADHATNLQTFEWANHSEFFQSVQGSLHRGFLNAYSRVERGSVLALTGNNDNLTSSLTHALQKRFGACTATSTTPGTSAGNGTASLKTKRKRRSGCRWRNEKLVIILREMVTQALRAGKTVHLSGHSLGACAVLCAADLACSL